VNICARLVDALDEELDELVDLHPVVADVTQLESVVEENMS
jgi:short-subunit dehydrogenase involved in D-alanine esterification of teichoic acids